MSIHILFLSGRGSAPRLQIDWQVAADIGKATLPSLVLQPLVENAIKHGMAKDGPLHLGLTAKLDKEHLLIQVLDDGAGIGTDSLSKINGKNGQGLGIGLRNVRERLHSLYGTAGLMSIDSTVGEGTQVTLRIPVPRRVNEN